MGTVGWLVLAGVGVALIVWGAETFAEHLAMASAQLGVSAFALAILLVGAEPEELVIAVTAALRDAPAIALGDVIGANVAMCLVALGLGAVLAPLPFGTRPRRYALAALPAGALAAWTAWDGTVSRLEGLLLVAAYAAFVATVWAVERQPPELGEAREVAEAEAELKGAEATPLGHQVAYRPGRDVVLVLLGAAALAVGALALVEGVRRVSGIESTQARLGLVVVGFATAFELVVLAWSSARRGIGEALTAGVVGSFTYNLTMTLGAGALARPLRVGDPALLRGPWLAMLAALLVVVALAWRSRTLRRPAGFVLLASIRRSSGPWWSCSELRWPGSGEGLRGQVGEERLRVTVHASAGQPTEDVQDVTAQQVHAVGALRIDGLWEVDDHQALLPDEQVVGGEVGVDHAVAHHRPHVLDEAGAQGGQLVAGPTALG